MKPLFNAFLFCLLVGCTQSAPPTIETKTQPNSQAETLDFAGERWVFSGTPSVHGDVSRKAMNARVFTADSPDVRVIEFVGANPATLLTEGVFERILQRQVQSGSRWVSDGPGELWLLDGGHEVCNYSNGTKL